MPKGASSLHKAADVCSDVVVVVVVVCWGSQSQHCRDQLSLGSDGTAEGVAALQSWG